MWCLAGPHWCLVNPAQKTPRQPGLRPPVRSSAKQRDAALTCRNGVFGCWQTAGDGKSTQLSPAQLMPWPVSLVLGNLHPGGVWDAECIAYAQLCGHGVAAELGTLLWVMTSFSVHMQDAGLLFFTVLTL